MGGAFIAKKRRIQEIKNTKSDEGAQRKRKLGTVHVYLYELGGHRKLTKYLVVVKGGGWVEIATGEKTTKVE